MEPSIELMNDELVAQVSLEEKTEEIPIKTEVKKNSKKHIIERIFQLCKEFNFEIQETEQQLFRKTRKNLLAILASYVERSMESKIKSETNGIPPDCQGSQYQKNLPMLRLAHGFLASLVEKGFNIGCNYMDYSYELHHYASTCNQSLMIDDCLLAIADDMGPDLLNYISSPYYRLMFVHCTSIMSCVRRIDREEMQSPRFSMDNIGQTTV